MNLLRIMDSVSSGLSAQRTRMEVASANLANAQTTRTPEGGPYRRQDVVLASNGEDGVKVAEIRKDQSPPRLQYDPGHPDADERGMVAYPNVSVVEEMVDMITASRAYEAGLTALSTSTAMADSALEIGR